MKNIAEGVIESIVISIVSFIGLEVALNYINTMMYWKYTIICFCLLLGCVVLAVGFYWKFLFKKEGLFRKACGKFSAKNFIHYFYYHFAAYLSIYVGTVILLVFTYKGFFQQILIISASLAGFAALLFSFHLLKYSPLSKDFDEKKHGTHVHARGANLLICSIYAFYKLYAIFVCFVALYAISLYHVFSFLGLGVITGFVSYLVIHHNFLIHHKWTWRLKMYILNFSIILGLLSVILYILNFNYIFAGLIFVFLFSVCEGVFIHIMKRNYTKRTFTNYAVLLIILAAILIIALSTNKIFEGKLKIQDNNNHKVTRESL